MVCNSSIDEQHCNFRLNHVENTHVKFKRGSDGYLCGAIFAYGYNYVVCPSNSPAQNDYTDEGYSTFNSCVILLQIVIHPNLYKIEMEILYISEKFLKAYFLLFGLMLYGVCRVLDHDITSNITSNIKNYDEKQQETILNQSE